MHARAATIQNPTSRTLHPESYMKNGLFSVRFGREIAPRGSERWPGGGVCRLPEFQVRERGRAPG